MIWLRPWNRWQKPASNCRMRNEIYSQLPIKMLWVLAGKLTTRRHSLSLSLASFIVYFVCIPLSLLLQIDPRGEWFLQLNKKLNPPPENNSLPASTGNVLRRNWERFAMRFWWVKRRPHFFILKIMQYFIFSIQWFGFPEYASSSSPWEEKRIRVSIVSSHWILGKIEKDFIE